MFALSRPAPGSILYSLTAAVGQHQSTACSTRARTWCTAERATGGAGRPEYVITSHDRSLFGASGQKEGT